MKVLRESAKIFGRMLQKPKIQTANYVPSVYNYIKELEETVLVNTFSRCVVVLEEADKAVLSRKSISVEEDTCSDTLRKMIELRILVREDEDELKYYLEVYELLYTLTGKRKKSYYKIFPTMACNARCFYCFEQGAEPKSMSDETTDAVFDYIMRTKHDKEIEIYWFGGEPLCNVRVVTRLSQKLKDANVPFFARMTTNGLLFNEQMADEAVQLWNLKKCQITLDGMPEEYKRRKNYKGNIENPFQIVTENIERLAKRGVQVNIRMNVDADNIDSVLELKEYIRARFGMYSNVSAYPTPLYDDWGSYKNIISAEKWLKLYEKCVEIQEDIASQDMQVKAAKLSEDIPTYSCEANARVAAIISPEGNLSLCQNYSSEMYYGDIWQGVTKPELYEKWTHNAEPVEKCKTCPLLPECTAFQLCPTGTKNCKSERFNTFNKRLKATYNALKAEQ